MRQRPMKADERVSFINVSFLPDVFILIARLKCIILICRLSHIGAPTSLLNRGDNQENDSVAADVTEVKLKSPTFGNLRLFDFGRKYL